MKRYLFITCMVILFDQISKYYIKSSFIINSSIDIIEFSFLKLSCYYVQNSGLALGMPANILGINIYYIVVFLSLLIIYYIYNFEMKKVIQESNSTLKLISLSLILGGAIGNIIDRFFVIFGLFGYEGVVDFISVDINKIIIFGKELQFPYIFNIADASVTIGIILYILHNFLFSYLQNRSSENAEAKEI